MEPSTKIALAIVGTAVIGAATFIGYREYDRARDLREGRQALAELQAGAEQADRDTAAFRQRLRDQQALTAQFQEHQAQDRYRRRVLQDGQRCIAGTVVEVRGNVYTQRLGNLGAPIPCQGSVALQDLR